MKPDNLDVILKSLRELCILCKLIANNTEMVRPRSASCLPMSKCLQEWEKVSDE